MNLSECLFQKNHLTMYFGLCQANYKVQAQNTHDARKKGNVLLYKITLGMGNTFLADLSISSNYTATS